jgi:hypothetical protein
MNPNPNESSDLNVATLFALRQETDAIRIITERLLVREMGPADHIRTKHEVKAFVESGDPVAAEELLKAARERREVNQSVTQKISPQHGQRLTE